MQGSEFTFDGVESLYYDLNTVSLSRGISYIDSPEWLKNKKATINPKNNDNRCFQYALTVALNHEQIKKDPQRIPQIKPYMIPAAQKILGKSKLLICSLQRHPKPPPFPWWGLRGKKFLKSRSSRLPEKGFARIEQT